MIDRTSFSSKVIAFIDDVNSKVYASGFNATDFSFGYFPCYDYFDGRGDYSGVLRCRTGT